MSRAGSCGKSDMVLLHFMRGTFLQMESFAPTCNGNESPRVRKRIAFTRICWAREANVKLVVDVHIALRQRLDALLPMEIDVALLVGVDGRCDQDNVVLILLYDPARCLGITREVVLENG